ncbi:MAG TPA: VWA domain-containing protein [Acidimicrobiales bacterium]|nr:VWA domain-containing protein [Acidimicrobiales bacterium]
MDRGLGSIDLAEVVARLGRALHAAGLPVTPDRSGRFAAAIDLARPARVDELFWLARVTLVNDRAQFDAFDRVMRQIFAGVWDPADFRGAANVVSLSSQPIHDVATRPRPRPSAGSRMPSPLPAPAALRDSDEDDDADDGSSETLLAAMSEEERLRSRDFASLTSEELARLRVLMSKLALAPPPRRSRRSRRHAHGPHLDLRATLRRAHRSAGDPVEQIRRRRRSRPRRVVFICDISGSMEAYARAYLQLLHTAVGGAHAEAFVFATRLTRVTRALRTNNPDLALHRAGRAAPDWSGGTRIGDAVKTFNDRYGRRGLARGAVVVVVSDGWDRGDPALVGREMERLARLAHRVIWVNPRSAREGYAPLVGGIAAALPFVDELVSGHSIAALDSLLAAIAAP